MGRFINTSLKYQYKIIGPASAADPPTLTQNRPLFPLAAFTKAWPTGVSSECPEKASSTRGQTAEAKRTTILQPVERKPHSQKERQNEKAEDYVPDEGTR